MNPRNKIFAGAASVALLAGAYLWEDEKLTPYQDVVGVWTVCVGHTGPDVIKGKRYTKEECKAFLDRELRSHGDAVLKCTKVPLTQYQYDAFTLFTYNVGKNAFCSSKSVLVPLNKGDYDGACKGLLKWVYADGKYVQGLANRRQYEYRLCMGQYAK